MAARLTPYEKETIIITNEAEDEWIFETFNTGYKRRLEAFSEKYPAYCQMKLERPEGAVKYIVKKECFSVHFNAPYTEERRQKSRDQAKKNGLVGGNPPDAA